MQEKYGLYIHVPFCVQKCQYCDFVSFSGALSYEDSYVDALIIEMAKYKGTEVDTIYFGGGTPSLLSKMSIQKLMNALGKNFHIDDSCEITMEMNPKTVDIEKMKLYHELGINRASIGIQSFLENELSMLGRIHSPQDGIEAVKMADAVGIKNISIDIMYGFFMQTMESLRNTLDQAIKLPISHISCYGLRVEDETPFGRRQNRGETITLEEDQYADMYAYIVELLKTNGFNRYEISNFCKDKKISHHNMKYWKNAPYIGLGAAAHSYFAHTRRANTADLKKYLEDSSNSYDVATLVSKDEKSEYIITALRLVDGFSLSDYKAKFNSDFRREFSSQIEKFSKLNLLKIEEERCYLTPQAFYVSNSILCEFVFEE